MLLTLPLGSLSHGLVSQRAAATLREDLPDIPGLMKGKDSLPFLVLSLPWSMLRFLFLSPGLPASSFCATSAKFHALSGGYGRRRGREQAGKQGVIEDDEVEG